MAKPREFKSAIQRTMTRTKTEWMREAKYRVPVETGVTRNTILGNTSVGPDEAVCEVGSNQKHAAFIEFGTKFIAGGSVAAMGRDPEITDAQAVHTWAAKDQNETSRTSRGLTVDGRLANRQAVEIKGKRGQVGMQEQMPWLRTSFMKIRLKVIIWLGDCLRPKK